MPLTHFLSLVQTTHIHKVQVQLFCFLTYTRCSVFFTLTSKQSSTMFGMLVRVQKATIHFTALDCRTSCSDIALYALLVVAILMAKQTAKKRERTNGTRWVRISIHRREYSSLCKDGFTNQRPAEDI